MHFKNTCNPNSLINWPIKCLFHKEKKCYESQNFCDFKIGKKNENLISVTFIIEEEPLPFLYYAIRTLSYIPFIFLLWFSLRSLLSFISHDLRVLKCRLSDFNPVIITHYCLILSFPLVISFV